MVLGCIDNLQIHDITRGFDVVHPETSPDWNSVQYEFHSICERKGWEVVVLPTSQVTNTVCTSNHLNNDIQKISSYSYQHQWIPLNSLWFFQHHPRSYDFFIPISSRKPRFPTRGSTYWTWGSHPSEDWNSWAETWIIQINALHRCLGLDPWVSFGWGPGLWLFPVGRIMVGSILGRLS